MSIYYYRGSKNILEGTDEKRSIEIIADSLQQNCLSTNLCFLIGSGCSSPAIPMMGNTFETIKENSIFKKNKELLGKFTNSTDIEGYLNWLDKGIDFYCEDEKVKPYKEAFDLTKKMLVKSILIDYDGGEGRKVLETYSQFYNLIFDRRQYNTTPEPVNVFTTNYDIFNELALESAQILYDNGFDGYINRRFSPYSFNLRIVDEENRHKDKWSPIRKHVRLYKIHGSIDWVYRNNIIYQAKVEELSDIENIENVIIYPTLAKHLDTQQTPYSELFREFNIKLQEKNTTLIVIGYGFPDTHINYMISQALYNSDFNLIIFSNIEEENPKMFYESNKGNSNLHFIGGKFEEDEDGEKGGKLHYFNNIVNLLSPGSESREVGYYATT